MIRNLRILRLFKMTSRRKYSTSLQPSTTANILEYFSSVVRARAWLHSHAMRKQLKRSDTMNTGIKVLSHVSSCIHIFVCMAVPVTVYLSRYVYMFVSMYGDMDMGMSCICMCACMRACIHIYSSIQYMQYESQIQHIQYIHA